MLNKIIRYFLTNPLVTVLVLIGFVVAGVVNAPFRWKTGILPSDPIPVDAIPDIGENQQIVFTSWPGRSPQDIEDQISFPLTTFLLGIPGVKSIRSSSIFGFSSIYLIFSEKTEFYWSRSRILEKLSSLPAGFLPQGVQPSLGPDATALGQVFWYTIEGRTPDGRPTGGWDLHEIRAVQDFFVKYALNAVEGVSEVASIGGFVQEYQVDVNPDALNAYRIPLQHVIRAVQKSNRDIGAKTIEINQAEYFIRGIGTIKKIEDLEKAVVAMQDNVPIRIGDIAVVSLGPSERRGILDKDGAEVVGGVIVARYGANPLEVINRIHEKINEISSGLPRKTLSNGIESRLTIVPFYDRSGLINETLGTLEEALSLEILITILVVIVMVANLRASFLISSLLPVSILMVFIAMRRFGVDANIVALSGIAIAIGTMVDLGIILSENIIRHIDELQPGQSLLETVYSASAEVGSALLTAVSTTIVSFIPVFSLQAAEGKLFAPLAFTKTFALLSSLIVSITILPTLASWFFRTSPIKKSVATLIHGLILIAGLIAFWKGLTWAGTLLIAFGIISMVKKIPPVSVTLGKKWLGYPARNAGLIIVVIGVIGLLTRYWLPLGAGKSLLTNAVFISMLLALILGGFAILQYGYSHILKWCLNNKTTFLLLPVLLAAAALNIWLGFDSVFSPVAAGLNYTGWNVRSAGIWSLLSQTFPGIGKEFMPALDEGSFLLMPTTMPHAGTAFNRRILGQLDMMVSGIPEVELTVGKAGRVDSALDPAPLSMYENIINYKPEYILDDRGRRRRFKVDENDRFVLNDGERLTNHDALIRGVSVSRLIPDGQGRYFRNWRSHIRSPDDIWAEIVKVTVIPGVTSAPKLQPIETRLVMLQTGMRAPMGIKVFGPDLNTIEEFGLELETILKGVPSVKSEAVFADRIVGKPYLNLTINRDEISRYGLNVDDLQSVIETTIGGIRLTSTVEGRERYNVRVRYPRELRNDTDTLSKILVDTPTGIQIPLGQLVDIEYSRGPQMIKSEDTFLVGYVLFDKKQGVAEVNVVTDAQQAIANAIRSGKLTVPAGVSLKFSGNYENQLRAEKRLAFIIPVVLLMVFLILYFQFRSVSTSLMVFTGIGLAFSGGFIMLWLYGQNWFADVSVFGVNLRTLFRIHPINLSVAVWVGFIALFGIATDDGVLMSTYLDQSFSRKKPSTLSEIRSAVIEAGNRRIRPAVMTSATTIIALLPILTSTGKGADIMIPMAIPAFGGMIIAAITYFIVPTLYCIREERKLRKFRA